jgi:hypothetical protein
MHPLAERSRRHLLALAAVLCSVPVTLWPIAARSSLSDVPDGAARAHHLTSSLPPLQWRSHTVRCKRDPFAGDPETTTLAKAVPGTASQQAVFVEAIATGARSRALVQDGDQARIVTTGDPLAGSRVSVIGSAAVRLANGTILPMKREKP